MESMAFIESIHPSSATSKPNCIQFLQIIFESHLKLWFFIFVQMRDSHREAIILLILLLICTKDKGRLERAEGKKTPFIPVVKYIIMHISDVWCLRQNVNCASVSTHVKSNSRSKNLKFLLMHFQLFALLLRFLSLCWIMENDFLHDIWWTNSIVIVRSLLFLLDSTETTSSECL